MNNSFLLCLLDNNSNTYLLARDQKWSCVGRLKKDPESAAGQKDCSLAAPRDVTRFGLLNIEGVGERNKKSVWCSITFGVAKAENEVCCSTYGRKNLFGGGWWGIVWWRRFVLNLNSHAISHRFAALCSLPSTLNVLCAVRNVLDRRSARHSRLDADCAG